MKNKTYIVGVTIAAIILISALLIFRNNAENGETTEETSVVSPTISQSSITPSATNTSDKTYSLAEVTKHNNKSDCWLAIDGNVYNVTTFIDNHPGGDEILRGCGTDATNLFNSVRDHAREGASEMLPTYIIGKLQ